MSSNYVRRCPVCKGIGCIKCEGTGVKLQSKAEESYSDASEISGDKIFADDPRFIDLEEEDYEV